MTSRPERYAHVLVHCLSTQCHRDIHDEPDSTCPAQPEARLWAFRYRGTLSDSAWMLVVREDRKRRRADAQAPTVPAVAELAYSHETEELVRQ